MIRFLVIRLSSIGDIVLTSPVVRCIKNQIKNAEIHFLTKIQYKTVVEHNPHIDKVWLYNENLPELISELKKQKFHYIIDLHHNIRTWRIKNSLRCLAFSFNKLNFEKWLLVNFNINRLPEKHIVDRYLDTLSLFDVRNDGKGLDYFTGPGDEKMPENLPFPFPDKYLALCIGAQHFTKKAPPEKLAVLCDNLTIPILILGGKEDNQMGRRIMELSSNKNIINLAGVLSLNQSAIMIKNSSLVITHDTGLMHIAAAYKKRIISLWGNTIPEFGMYPYLPREGSVRFEVKGLPCRPCTKIGFNECPKKHFRCMNDLDFEEIGRTAEWH